MAAVINTSVEPKYARHRAVADEEGKARIAAYRNWVELSLDKKGINKGAAVPEEFFPKTLRLVKGKRLFDYNDFMEGG